MTVLWRNGEDYHRCRGAVLELLHATDDRRECGEDEKETSHWNRKF